MSYQRHNKPRIDVSIVIPAHNEEDNVQPLLEQFAELEKKARFSLEVIMVDDGSTDRTLPRIVETQSRYRFVHVVSVPVRRGLTEALQAGFSVVNGSIVVFYPADRQFHPNDIPRMVDKVREGYDLVTGRKIGEYNKRVVSGVYNRISRMLFPSIQVTDLNSVKAFRRELTDVFDYRHDWHRFWVAIVAEAGYRIGEVDVTLYQRKQGRSKFGMWRIPGAVLDLLAVKFQYHTMRRPLWYFGMVGSVLLLAALGLGLWALYQRYVMQHGYRPLLYLVMTLGISGVVFFALGFLAESVAGIRQRLDTVKGGPRRHYYQAPSRSRPRPTGGSRSPSRDSRATESSDQSGAKEGSTPERQNSSSSSSTSRPRRYDRGRRPRGSSNDRNRQRDTTRGDTSGSGESTRRQQTNGHEASSPSRTSESESGGSSDRPPVTRPAPVVTRESSANRRETDSKNSVNDSPREPGRESERTFGRRNNR